MILAQIQQDFSENPVPITQPNPISSQTKNIIELISSHLKSKIESNETVKEDSEFNAFDGNELEENSYMFKEINDFDENEIENQTFDASNITVNK